MQVKIISDEEVQRKVDKVLSKLMLDTQHIGLYAGTWREQMIEAVRFGDDEEEDGRATRCRARRSRAGRWR